MSGMKLTKDVMNDLCHSGLGKNILIENLKLANCGISNASAVVFCNKRHVDSTIGVLEWQGNVLQGTVGVTALFRAVPFHASLNCLKLNIWIYRPGNYRKCHGGYLPKGTSFKRLKRNQVYGYRVASAFTGGSRKNVYL